MLFHSMALLFVTFGAAAATFGDLYDLDSAENKWLTVSNSQKICFLNNLAEVIWVTISEAKFFGSSSLWGKQAAASQLIKKVSK
jgi:hypothetical protein